MTAMKPLSGKDLRLKRKNGAAYDLLAVVTTKGLERVNTFDEALAHDDADPRVPPWRVSEIKGRAWNVQIAGTTDAAKFKVLAGDCDANAPVTYRLEVALAAAAGGGHWEGDIWFENLSLSDQENGIVRFSGQLRGDGPLAWTDAPSS
ncbi:MAG TPA: hypothetical protein VM434_15745 [Beijerinckiaceae bacterium]|nr:hypothetical protein [Beijerinckiaceae bacterium]